MTFSFLNQNFDTAFDEITKIAEFSNKMNSHSDLRSLLDEHLNLKKFINSDYKKELDKVIVYTKNEFDYVKILKNLNDEDERNKIILSCSLIYLYFTEYEFKQKQNESSDLLNFIIAFKLKVKIALSHMGSEPYPIMYADTKLAFDLLREVFHSPQYLGLLTLEEKLQDIKKYCNEWDNSYSIKKDEVEQLNEKLNTQKSLYDFVLLNQGFNNLYNQKKNDLIQPENIAKWLFTAILAVPIFEIIVFGILLLLEKSVAPVTVWYVLVPSISLILFLFYFYRINLQEARSIKSQMMQLELRMALCQFIHNYAEDSEKLHAKNKAGFEKFENIIFSPLVSSDDKIPTTFDGMEQLAKMVEVFRKN